MNARERIERIEALEAEFNERLKALKAEEQQDFPQFGDDYWYVDDDTEVLVMKWYNSEYDQGRLSIGNVFKNKDQAEFAAEKLRVEAELRKFSRPFEPTTENFFIVHDKYVESLEIDCSLKTDIQGVIYFDSRDKLRQAVETVGIDRIKKYIFGWED